jgi:hypothetical protein
MSYERWANIAIKPKYSEEEDSEEEDTCHMSDQTKDRVSTCMYVCL